MSYPHSNQFSHWRSLKLQSKNLMPTIVKIDDLKCLKPTEYQFIAAELQKFNYVIYEDVSSTTDFEHVSQIFFSQLGLQSLDKHLCVAEDQLTKIYDNAASGQSFYIPYTNKPINWHTDGYYNIQSQKVLSFVLHCAHPAFEGGSNSLLDQDQVFIYLHSQNPLYIDALMKPDVMTIPENRKDGVLLRPETSTAIFDVINDRHDVLMRYSMRKKNIIFKEDVLTKEALSCMDDFINSKSSPSTSIKLKAGQGVLCNNVLHKRTAFKDKAGSERLYYRARYYNRIHIK